MEVAEENPLNSACTSLNQTFDDPILDHVSNPITNFTYPTVAIAVSFNW